MSLRKFTRALGRFKAGEPHDYPRNTWSKILENAKAMDPKIKSLDDFSQELESPMLQSTMRGTGRPTRPRLGT